MSGVTRRLSGLSPRAELTVILLLGVAGAGIVFLALRQGWAQVRTDLPAPLPDSVVTDSGQALVPLAGALDIAALASLAAVLATRGLARRVAGGLLAALGATIAAAMLGGISAAAALAAAAQSTGPAGGTGAGSAPGSVTGGTASGTAVPGVGGFHARVVLTAASWQALVALGCLLLILAGLAVAWRAARLPVMSSRYDAPVAKESQEPSGAPPDSASMWESLSRGDDPTSHPANARNQA